MQSKKILKQCHFERREKSCICDHTNIINISPYGRNDYLCILDFLRDRQVIDKYFFQLM